MAVPPSQYQQRKAPEAFVFQRRSERIDWRSLVSVDLDGIVRDLDVQSLQRHLSNVTFCDIHTEQLNGVDQNFIKLFEMAQLMLEYVLFVQEQLAQSKEVCDGQLQRMIDELGVLQDSYDTTRKESKRRKHMLAAYQKLVDSNNVGPHKCPFCPKSFISTSYLLEHCERRHPDKAPFELPAAGGKKHETVTNSNIYREVQTLQRDFRHFNTSQAASAEETALDHRRLKNEIAQLQLELDTRGRVEEESRQVWTEKVLEQERNYKNMDGRYQLEIEELNDKHRVERKVLQQQLDRSISDLADRDAEIDTLRKQLRATTIQLKADHDELRRSFSPGGAAQTMTTQEQLERLQEAVLKMAAQPVTHHGHPAAASVRVEGASVVPDGAGKTGKEKRSTKSKSSGTKKSKSRPKSTTAGKSRAPNTIEEAVGTAAATNAVTNAAADATAAIGAADAMVGVAVGELGSSTAGMSWADRVGLERRDTTAQLGQLLSDAGIQPGAKKMTAREFKAQMSALQRQQKNKRASNPYFAESLAEVKTDLSLATADKKAGRPLRVAQPPAGFVVAPAAHLTPGSGLAGVTAPSAASASTSRVRAAAPAPMAVAVAPRSPREPSVTAAAVVAPTHTPVTGTGKAVAAGLADELMSDGDEPYSNTPMTSHLAMHDSSMHVTARTITQIAEVTEDSEGSYSPHDRRDVQAPRSISTPNPAPPTIRISDSTLLDSVVSGTAPPSDDLFGGSAGSSPLTSLSDNTSLLDPAADDSLADTVQSAAPIPPPREDPPVPYPRSASSSELSVSDSSSNQIYSDDGF